MKRRLATASIVVAAGLSLPGCAPAPQQVQPIPWGEIEALPRPPADHRIPYGSDPLQYGELRLPEGGGPFPVLVFIHGGCWMSEYDLSHVAAASAALTEAGIAVWTIEYRRVGDPGGGWPGTFEDAARATDALRDLAERFPLDLDRVVLMGHSAGGHLALWLAARVNLPEDSPLRSDDPLPVRGVISLAGITDLVRYGSDQGDCNAAVARLLGGPPDEVAERYAAGNPVTLLPLCVPTRLVHGTLDPIVPVEQSRGFQVEAQAQGEDVRLIVIEGVGHFDPIAPPTVAWETVERTVLELLDD